MELAFAHYATRSRSLVSNSSNTATIPAALVEPGLLSEILAMPPVTALNELIDAGLRQRQQFGTAAAVPFFERAARVEPDSHLPYFMLGNALTELWDLDAAVPFYERALSLQSNDHVIRYNLGLTHYWRGYTQLAIDELQVACRLSSSYLPAHTTLIMALHNSDRVSPEEIAQTTKNWGHRFSIQHPYTAPTAASKPISSRPLRVGFVSGDFRTHSVAQFFEPIASAYDRDQFVYILYSNFRHQDQVTARLRGLADVWHDVWTLSDEALTNIIRADEIDVLVDLAGHTEGNRLSLFARRAAPVQATYLGYPNSTGLPTMDYRITDANTDPYPDADAWNVEKLLRLPDSQWCFRPSGKVPSVESTPARTAGFITFGSFNNLTKLSDTILECWIQILSRVTASRLRLTRIRSPQRAAEIVSMFRKAGISPDRIDLISYTSDSPRGLQFTGVDIALDPFPYNGVTTTCEALSAGVPVVSLCGRHCVSRSGLSILKQVSLPELVASTPQQYTETAVSLAGNLARLERVRAVLQRQFEQSSLRDEKRFARQFGDALLEAAEQIPPKVKRRS